MTALGYIQAGGESTRFGGDKALSVIGGTTTLSRTVELVRSVCGEVWIVAAAGKYAGGPAPIVGDRWPGEGPLGGILTALLETQRQAPHVAWNLIVSCDMVFLTREWLAFLCECAEKSSARVLVPETRNGLEPLCACWKTSAAGEVQTAFDGGVRKVAQAMKRLSMEVLDESAWKRFDTDGRLFWNMNTRADYEEARRIIEARKP